jgi:TRAP-type C4-dicarboxylate transport system substrate-binding protein
MIELIFHNIHDHGVNITELWTQEIERRSGGQVHFSLYTAGGPQLTARADVVRDVPAGGGQYPLLDLVQTPLVFPGATAGSRVLAQLYAEFPELGLELNDFKVAGLSLGALMAVFSSRKWGPIRTLADLKGARTRSLLPIDSAIASLGAIPMHVDYLDIARQLESGELDATILGLLPAKMFDLADRGAPYCTLTGNLSITMHPMRSYFKWDSWNKLPMDIQKIIDSLGPAGGDCWFAVQSGVDADRHLEEALDYFRRRGEIIALAPAELARWQERLQPLRQSCLNALEARGLPAKKYFARMLELVEKGYNSN